PRVRHCPLPHCPSSGVPSPNLRLGDKAPRMSPPRSGGRGKPSPSGETRLAPLAPPPGLRPYSPAPLPLHGGEILMPPPWLCPSEPQAKGGRFLPPNEVRREVGGSRSHQQDLPRDQPDPRVRHCPLPHCPSSGVPSPNLRLGDKAPRMSPPQSGGRYRR